MHGGSLLVAKRHSKLTALIWITLGAASSVPILVLFVHFGKLEYARPTSAAILVEIVAIKVCWELRRRFWFWLTLLFDCCSPRAPNNVHCTTNDPCGTPPSVSLRRH